MNAAIANVNRYKKILLSIIAVKREHAAINPAQDEIRIIFFFI